MWGDQYYDALARHTICSGYEIGPSLDSVSLATSITECVPCEFDYLTNFHKFGSEDISGLRDFLKTHETTNGRMPGGQSVIVFENVNIGIEPPCSSLSAQAKAIYLKEKWESRALFLVL